MIFESELSSSIPSELFVVFQRRCRRLVGYQAWNHHQAGPVVKIKSSMFRIENHGGTLSFFFSWQVFTKLLRGFLLIIFSRGFEHSKHPLRCGALGRWLLVEGLRVGEMSSHFRGLFLGRTPSYHTTGGWSFVVGTHGFAWCKNLKNLHIFGPTLGRKTKSFSTFNGSSHLKSDF